MGTDMKGTEYGLDMAEVFGSDSSPQLRPQGTPVQACGRTAGEIKRGAQILGSLR